MADQIAMIPASGDEADQILVLEQKVEEMKSKGWTVVTNKSRINCRHQPDVRRSGLLTVLLS